MIVEESRLICIGCPKGCHMNIKHTGKTIHEVTDFGCKIGRDYAYTEFAQPKRIITTTVKVNSGDLPFVPVKTKESVNKEQIFEIMKIINSIEIQSPVKVGDVIMPDIGGTGVDLVATRNIQRVS